MGFSSTGSHPDPVPSLSLSLPFCSAADNDDFSSTPLVLEFPSAFDAAFDDTGSILYGNSLSGSSSLVASSLPLHQGHFQASGSTAGVVSAGAKNNPAASFDVSTYISTTKSHANSPINATRIGSATTHSNASASNSTSASANAHTRARTNSVATSTTTTTNATRPAQAQSQNSANFAASRHAATTLASTNASNTDVRSFPASSTTAHFLARSHTLPLNLPTRIKNRRSRSITGGPGTGTGTGTNTGTSTGAGNTSTMNSPCIPAAHMNNFFESYMAASTSTIKPPQDTANFMALEGFPTMASQSLFGGPDTEDDAYSIACTSNCNDCPTTCQDPDCDVISEVCTNANCTDAVSCTIECDDICEVTCSDLGCQANDVASAAQALASFGEQRGLQLAQDEHQQQHQQQQQQHQTPWPDFSQHATGRINADHGHSQIMAMHDNDQLLHDHGIFQELYSDLLNFHDDSQPSDQHMRPCIADNANLWPGTCHLPRQELSDLEMLLQEQEQQYHMTPIQECGITLANAAQAHSHLRSVHNMSTKEIENSLLAQFPCSFGMNSLFGMDAMNAATWNPAHQHHHSRPLAQVAEQKLPVPKALPDVSSSLATPPATSEPRTPNPHARTDSPAVEDATMTSSLESNHVCKWTDDGPACNMAFDSEEALNNHLLMAHAKSSIRKGNEFVCCWESCSRRTGNKGFGQRSKLERHLQTHSGYKPYQCSTCKEHFSAKQALEQHIRTHTNDRPFPCRYIGCDKRFKQQSSLTMHERIHTGEKPLACPFPGCNMRFNESSNLAKHRRTHNLTGMHICSECGRDFHRLDQLRRHAERVHAGSGVGLAAVALGKTAAAGCRVAKASGLAAAAAAAAMAGRAGSVADGIKTEEDVAVAAAVSSA